MLVTFASRSKQVKRQKANRDPALRKEWDENQLTREFKRSTFRYWQEWIKDFEPLDDDRRVGTVTLTAARYEKYDLYDGWRSGRTYISVRPLDSVCHETLTRREFRAHKHHPGLVKPEGAWWVKDHEIRPGPVRVIVDKRHPFKFQEIMPIG